MAVGGEPGFEVMGDADDSEFVGAVLPCECPQVRRNPPPLARHQTLPGGPHHGRLRWGETRSRRRGRRQHRARLTGCRRSSQRSRLAARRAAASSLSAAMTKTAGAERDVRAGWAARKSRR